MKQLEQLKGNKLSRFRLNYAIKVKSPLHKSKFLVLGLSPSASEKSQFLNEILCLIQISRG